MRHSPVKSLGIILTLLALTFSPIGVTPAYAVWIFSNKTTANGLGDDIVYGVYANSGVVYAATYGGLSISTDGGSSFVNRTTNEGLGANYVYCVYASGGTVYAGTANGLSISTDGGVSFNNKTTANGLGDNVINGVDTSGGAIYAATGGGLSISTDSGTSFTNKTTANGLGNNFVRGVYVTGSTVYAATDGGLSISFNSGGSFVNKTTADGLGSNTVRGVFVTGGKIYAATDGGLSISSNGGVSFINKTIANGLGNNVSTGVFVSGSMIYVSTIGGISISEDGGSTFVNKTTANGLGNNHVYGVSSYGGVVYAATKGGGLSIGKNYLTARSMGVYDGWIIESTETSAVGGSMNPTSHVFRLGDDIANRQYRAILHFNTSYLPDTAIITKATLKIKRQGLVGMDPFTTLGGLRVDMSQPYFGTTIGLVLNDFQAVAGRPTVAIFGITPVSDWYSAVLNATGRAYINRTGATQFRLRFALDDNNDFAEDYMQFFSGDYIASQRPTLLMEYYVP